jgi:protein gp37
MTLNKQGPGKIEWTDWTWNPVTGCYGPGGTKEAKKPCFYCFARDTATRYKGGAAFPDGFEPQFREKYLGDFDKMPWCNLSDGTKIFVSDMGDLFGDWVPDEWIEKVIEVTRANSHLIFQFLTKNPNRYADFEFQFDGNCWLGTTVESADEMHRFGELQHVVGEEHIIFISFEPLLGDVLSKPMDESYRWYPEDIDWIIVGAMTGMRAAQFQPNKEWVENLILNSRINGTPIFLKSNLNWPEKIQEYPGGRVA